MGSATGVWGLQFGSLGLLRHLFRFVPSPHGDSEEIRHLVSQEIPYSEDPPPPPPPSACSDTTLLSSSNSELESSLH